MSTELEKVQSQELATVVSRIKVQDWTNALFHNTDYEEINPDYMTMRLMHSALTAETSEEILAPNELEGLQKLIPDVAGAYLGPFTMVDLYVARSDQGQGYATYVYLEMWDETQNKLIRTTTGAGQIQSQILGHIVHGIWPFRARIVRLDKVDQGGRHLLRMVTPD